MLKRSLIPCFFIIVVVLFADDYEDFPHKPFSYVSHEPFIVNYKGVNVPLLGNGEEIKALLGNPDLEEDVAKEDRISWIDEYVIKYGNYFVVRYNPITKNILYVTSNDPELTLMGEKVIGMNIDTFIERSDYKFEDESGNGFYRYCDFGGIGGFTIPGLEFVEYRNVAGYLILAVVVEEGKISWMYMRFSEYAP